MDGTEPGLGGESLLPHTSSPESFPPVPRPLWAEDLSLFPGLAACLTAPNRPGQPQTLYGQVAAFRTKFKTALGPPGLCCFAGLVLKPHCPLPSLLRPSQHLLWSERQPCTVTLLSCWTKQSQAVRSGPRLPGLNPSFSENQITTNRYVGSLRDGICSCFHPSHPEVESRLSLLVSAPRILLCPPLYFWPCHL